MLSRLSFVCAFVFLVAASSAPAWAQPSQPDEVSAEDKENARTLFVQGDEKYRAGDYEGALKAFQAADEIMGVPTTGLEHARTLMKLSRLIEARDGFIRVANLPKRPDEQDAQQTARDEAKKLADDLATRIPSVRVAVSNLPQGATLQLRIDGKDIPPTAVEFARKVDPGSHEVKVFVSGFKPIAKSVVVAEKEERVFEVTLEPANGDENTVDPWAGKEPGDNGGDESFLSTLSWIGFSVGAVGLAVAVPTGIYAIVEKEKIQDLCGADQLCDAGADAERLNTAVAVAHVSTVGFVFAGVGIAAGVVGILVRKSLPDALAGTDAPLTLEPFVGPGSVGVTGRF